MGMTVVPTTGMLEGIYQVIHEKFCDFKLIYDIITDKGPGTCILAIIINNFN